MPTLMGFGPARFQIETHTFEQLDRRLSIRHSPIDIVGARPSLHFIGPGEEAIDISATVFPNVLHRAGPTHIELLRELALAGLPQMMVTGSGRVLGTFVLVQVGDRRSVFSGSGNAARIEVSLGFLYKPAGTFQLANLGRLFG